MAHIAPLPRSAATEPIQTRLVSSAEKRERNTADADFRRQKKYPQAAARSTISVAKAKGRVNVINYATIDGAWVDWNARSYGIQ
jgi:hypothetical protein